VLLLCQLIRFIDNQGLHLLAGLALPEGDCPAIPGGGAGVGEETRVVERRVIQHRRIGGGVKKPTSYIKAKNIICYCTYQQCTWAAGVSNMHQFYVPSYSSNTSFIFSLNFFWGGLFFPLSLFLCLAYFANFVEEVEEHHCSSSNTHPPHLLLFLGTKTSRCKSRCCGKTYNKRQS
jgi:hypothetical protein